MGPAMTDMIIALLSITILLLLIDLRSTKNKMKCIEERLFTYSNDEFKHPVSSNDKRESINETIEQTEPQKTHVSKTTGLASTHECLSAIAHDIRDTREELEAIQDRVAKQLDHRIERRILPYLESLLTQISHLSQETASAPIQENLYSLHATLSETFAILKIEEIDPRTDAPLNLALHRIVKSPEETIDPAAMAVAEVVRKGWRVDGAVLRPAEVCVRSTKSTISQENELEEQTNG